MYTFDLTDQKTCCSFVQEIAASARKKQERISTFERVGHFSLVPFVL
jgi:hypothetical protein